LGYPSHHPDWISAVTDTNTFQHSKVQVNINLTVALLQILSDGPHTLTTVWSIHDQNGT
jgi:hypothetical protein